MIIPIHGFVEGDTLGVLAVVHDHDTIDSLGERLLAAAAVRVHRPKSWSVQWRGERLPKHRTLAEVGLQPLERVDVIVEGAL